MTLRASSCKGALIRKNLSRNWLLPVGILVILLFQSAKIFTYAKLVSLSQDPNLEYFDYFAFGLEDYATGINEVIFAAVVSAVLFSYLHRKRQNSFYHSIPTTQNSLYLSSFLSGVLFYVLPWAIVTAISAIIILIMRNGDLLAVGYFLGVSSYRLLLYITFLTFASMGMVLCGRTFFGLLTGLLLAVIIPMTEVLFLALISPALFGISWTEDVILFFLSPFYLLYPMIDNAGDIGIALAKAGGYTLASILLSFFTLRIHRSRKEEHVGQNLVFPQTLPVVQFFLTPVFILICLAPISLFITDHFPIFIIIPLTIPAFFLARMLVLRNRKVFGKKDIMGCVGYVLLITTLILCFQLDLFGINRRVPDADRVQQVSVSVNGVEFKSRDPEDIAEVIAIHDRIIFHKDSLQKMQNSPYDNTITELKIDYALHRNRTLSRTYYLSDFSHEASKEIVGLAETYLCSGDHPQQQLEQIRQNAGDISFWTEDSYRIDLSTLQKQELFALLAEDLSNPDVDPMFLFTERDTENGLRIRFSLPEDPYLDHYIPREATATYAFLSKIAEETLGNN